MYRVLRPFEYFEPETFAETIKILSNCSGSAKVLAGGIDLIPKMRRREVLVTDIISIQRIKELKYIKGNGSTGLKIGAMANLRTVELSPTIAKDYIVLHEAVYQIASLQAKTMGTLVGNLCVGTPASDVATALMALGATLQIAGSSQQKEIRIEDFFIGPGKTILAPDEIVTEVSVPAVKAGTGGAFLNLSKTKADIAKVNAAVTITVSDNVCEDIRIALGAVAPTPIRCYHAEDIIKGQKLDGTICEQVSQIAAEACAPISDIRSEAEYRKEMSRVLVRRALEQALERAKS